MMILIFFLYFPHLINGNGREYLRGQHCDTDEDNLKSVIDLLVQEISEHANCIVYITDSVYRKFLDSEIMYDTSHLRYEIGFRDNEQFARPRKRIAKALSESKIVGCNAYVILVANGILVADFLQYAERERLINTLGNFIILHDNRLFRSDLHYLWNHIINVVFIRRYNAYKRRSGSNPINERITLDSVYYPKRAKSSGITKYIDSWHNGRLRYGNNHFRQNIKNLKNNPLRVAIFEHMPAVTEKSRAYYDSGTSNTEALGIEFELVQEISKAMKFKPEYYMPYNIESHKWGSKGENETYNGLLGEVVKRKATFYLGDLHYTLHHLNYFDLTIPYNTECLTFLTPEFRLYTWIAVVLTLILGGMVFFFLSLTYKNHVSFYKNQTSREDLTRYHGIRNLYLFTEVQNCILYTYSMLVQVSLPGLPNLMAIRVLIGWWWIYSILVAVAYRASMTATLANPVARVTIDTLVQLAKSSIGVGGWNEDSQLFFLMSSDPNSQEIGNKFQLMEDETDAIEKVANGTFSYYENIYLLRHARVKRQLLEKQMQENNTEQNALKKYNLHIMEECVVNMPIAIGLEKNSPLKPYVDIWIRRLIEIGLVEKWLSDVMEWSKITEIREGNESEKALVNFHKLQGAFIGIIVGYFFGFIILAAEILYWKFIVLRDPRFDKYHLDLYYHNEKPITMYKITV